MLKSELIKQLQSIEEDSEVIVITTDNTPEFNIHYSVVGRVDTDIYSYVGYTNKRTTLYTSRSNLNVQELNDYLDSTKSVLS